MPDSAARTQRQFATCVRGERIAREMTQEDLAFRAGLSLTYVGELERGTRMASLDTVRRIATAFGMTSAELLAAAKL